MRLLRKLVLKLVTMLVMVALLGAAMRYARPYLMKSAGFPTNMPTGTGTAGVHFSSEESDLMGTVFKSAIRLLTGSANRKELAGELSSKLYAGRGDAKTMAELGIETEQPGTPSKPGSNPSAPVRTASVANLPPLDPAAPAAGLAVGGSGLRNVFLTRLQRKAVANPELALAPVVLTGMLLVHGVRRRRRSPLDDLILPDMTALMPSDSAPYEMTHAVHALRAEDFELLVALVYQRQGYRVSMPAGLSGGRGGDFLLQRKAERLLVQCKNMRPDHRLPVERVRELHEAVTAAGATRGLFVASCGFTWDASNFAKTRGVTVIGARTLDALLTGAREAEGEDLLAVAQWAPRFMNKVKLTPPVCPTCEAEMEKINASSGTMWVCSQRPDCRGRRSARKYQDAPPPAATVKTIARIASAKPVRAAAVAAPATPAAPAEPAPAELPPSPVWLRAAFPSPKRLTARVCEKVRSLAEGASGQAPAHWTPAAHAPAPSRTGRGVEA